MATTTYTIAGKTLKGKYRSMCLRRNGSLVHGNANKTTTAHSLEEAQELLAKCNAARLKIIAGCEQDMQKIPYCQAQYREIISAYENLDLKIVTNINDL